MANTTNLNLVKPAGTDYALVSVINGNMDIIDSKVGAIPANESAQSQITALNNQIANATNTKISYETAFDVPVVSSGCHFYCDRIGKTIFIDIVLQPTSEVAINTQIAHINGISNILDTHTSCVGSNGTGARFLLAPNGQLKVERAMPANEWFSCSFVALYNANL